MLSLTKIDNRAVTVKSLTTNAYNSLSNADSILHYGKVYAPALFESDQKTHLLKKFKHTVKLVVGNTTTTFEVLHGETFDSNALNTFRNVVNNLEDDEVLAITYKYYNKQLNSLVTTPIVAINYANRSNTSSICALIDKVVTDLTVEIVPALAIDIFVGGTDGVYPRCVLRSLGESLVIPEVTVPDEPSATGSFSVDYSLTAYGLTVWRCSATKMFNVCVDRFYPYTTIFHCILQPKTSEETISNLKTRFTSSVQKSGHIFCGFSASPNFNAPTIDLSSKASSVPSKLYARYVSIDVLRTILLMKVSGAPSRYRGFLIVYSKTGSQWSRTSVYRAYNDDLLNEVPSSVFSDSDGIIPSGSYIYKVEVPTSRSKVSRTLRYGVNGNSANSNTTMYVNNEVLFAPDYVGATSHSSGGYSYINLLDDQFDEMIFILVYSATNSNSTEISSTANATILDYSAYRYVANTFHKKTRLSNGDIFALCIKGGTVTSMTNIASEFACPPVVKYLNDARKIVQGDSIFIDDRTIYPEEYGKWTMTRSVS